MRFALGALIVVIVLGWNVFLLAGQPAQTCKDMPVRCDKELLLLRGEVDNKRQAIAVLLDANEQLQARVEKAEASLKELQLTTIPHIPDPTTPVPASPKD